MGVWSHNNSFKPTPCIVASTACLALRLHAVRRPATGRLNSGVRRQKSVWWLCVVNTVTTYRLRWALLFGSVSRRHVASSVQVRLARSHITYIALAGFGNEVLLSFSFATTPDVVATETGPTG